MGIQKYGDQIGWGPFVQGDQILGDHLSMGIEFDGDHLSRGINFIGIVCPGGQELGDRESGDQMGSLPNALQPKIKANTHQCVIVLMATTAATISSDEAHHQCSNSSGTHCDNQGLQRK